jgi:hypothetical protein
LADTAAAERKPIADDLARAAATCTTLTPAERARLSVSSVTLQITPDGVTKVIGIVEDPVLAPKVADALQDLREEFFKAVKERGPAVGAAVRRRLDAHHGQRCRRSQGDRCGSAVGHRLRTDRTEAVLQAA